MDKKLKKFKTRWKLAVSENASYILVALFVSLILWVTLLSRKETRFIKEVPLEIVVADDRFYIEDPPKSVKIEVFGPRIAVRRFAEREDILTLDLGHVQTGSRRVKVPSDGLNLPPRVSLKAVQPHIVSVRIRERVESPPPPTEGDKE